MQCNIDSRGKMFRLILGMTSAIIGATLIALRQLGPLANQNVDWPLYAGIALLAFGAFGIFEARAGWCAMRAMGFKTRV